MRLDARGRRAARPSAARTASRDAVAASSSVARRAAARTPRATDLGDRPPDVGLAVGDALARRAPARRGRSAALARTRRRAGSCRRPRRRRRSTRCARRRATARVETACASTRARRRGRRAASRPGGGACPAARRAASAPPRLDRLVAALDRERAERLVADRVLRRRVGGRPDDDLAGLRRPVWSRLAVFTTSPIAV